MAWPRGGSRGRVQGVRTPLPVSYAIPQWCTPPKKNPGSAPVIWLKKKNKTLNSTQFLWDSSIEYQVENWVLIQSKLDSILDPVLQDWSNPAKRMEKLKQQGTQL